MRWTTMLLAAIFAFVLSACGQTDHSGMTTQTSQTTTAGTHTMPGMANTAMPGMATAPYDAQFIDGMVEHHRGAVVMAEQALTQAQRPELKQLAQVIIATQQQEITQMQGWRSQWFPNLAPTGGMSMPMDAMSVAEGPEPYDQRFLTAMIVHHQDALTMGRDALTKAEHAEIKQLATAIIAAQEAEIAQMQAWQAQWFGK